MKLLTYRRARGGASVGALLEDVVVDLPLLASRIRPGEVFPSAMLGLIGEWARLRPLLEELLARAPELRGEGEGRGGFFPEEEVVFFPPVPHPPKNVICLGLNYRDHVEEGLRAGSLSPQMAKVDHPIYFTKAHTSLLGHRGGIIHHPTTRTLDYEGELALVIGRRGRDIPPEGVYEHIFGYTNANDISARDRQRMHKQLFKGKSMDTHCPMGPYLVPKEYFGDPMDVMLRTWVNGELRQETNTSAMIHDIAAQVSVLSLGMTLEPGDIILTGTPSGVGYARETPTFLQPGDVVEVEVEGLGRLRNTVVAPEG
ncbi:MAG: fumarylacetoacetate hydrolase family protein [Nitrospinota bacterium]